MSVHGGDVLYTAGRNAAGAEAVRARPVAARLVLANSEGIAELARAHGARETRVVHLGTDLPAQARPVRRSGSPQTLVTVGHLVARKRHADVLRALAVLAPRHPTLRYAIVGDGPERAALEGLAARLGVAERVDFHGQLPHEQAVELARGCTLFVMPSTEEAFGVAYVEAMAGGVPAIGCRGEPGPEEIAAAGDGLVLVPPGDIERLTQRIDELLSDPHRLREVAPARAGHGGRELHVGALRPPDARRLRVRAAVIATERQATATSAGSAKPVLFVTGNALAYRVGALARLHEREGIELALFGGRSEHGGRRVRARAALPPPSRRATRAARAGRQRALPRGRLPDGRAPGAAGHLGVARAARACR